ncbi:hypothetical protein L7F22_045721 [Adiantum nelumboides]|nr:hypothetical protein [Adiantum nelumboides]
MTYYVPDWGDKSHGLTVFEEANPCDIRKGGVQQNRQLLRQSYHHQPQLKNPAPTLVPSHDVLDTLTYPGMQEDEATHSIDRSGGSSILALNTPVAMSNAAVHDDEMLAWLRYPVGDSSDRNYCSGMFGELMHPHLQPVKDVFLHQTMKEPESTHVFSIEGTVGSVAGLQQPTNTVSTSSSPKGAIKSDAAMALGAGRAAGLLSQTGLEAFNGVRTHSNACAFSKSPYSPVVDSTSDGNKTVQNMAPISTMPSSSSSFNFSVFCRPVATTLDNLRLLGVASGLTNADRARQPSAQGSQLRCSRHSTKSMVMSMPPPQQSTAFTTQDVGADYQSWYSSTSLPCGSVGRGHMDAQELNSHASCVSVSENVFESTDTVETTVSPSCLSESSNEKVGQEVVFPSPKKSLSSAQHSKHQDVEDVAANAKKPPPGPRAVKRTRAAEVHNESEKKRRNKINVRLKALQSLIPNSNKTDKASVLDEAIEYTKMLQAQVQFMSMKTGMFFPTMVPAGMHYVPLQQMPTFSHLGVGAGMGVDLGFGMHVADVNVANSIGFGVGINAGTGAGAGAAVNLSPTSHQPVSNHAHARPRLLHAGSRSPICDVSSGLQTACTSESYNVMLGQQPLQPVIMNVHMNADVYSASQQHRLPQENHITSAI